MIQSRDIWLVYVNPFQSIRLETQIYIKNYPHIPYIAAALREVRIQVYLLEASSVTAEHHTCANETKNS